MKDLYVGNTDHDWFDFCRSHSPLQEVNFWQPSRQHFKALTEGGIFFFRRKAPINKIAGFGVLASAAVATIETCWTELGIANGTRSKDEFLSRVKKYRKGQAVDDQSLVGYKILVDPVYLDEPDWIDVPDDWSPNIVTGKGYYLHSLAGERLHAFYLKHKHKNTLSRQSVVDGFSQPPAAGFTIGQSQKLRVGQGRFKFDLLSAYENRCAVSGTGVDATLEAAHIVPFAADPDNSVTNGLLLRSDIHSLFDRGLLYVDLNYRVRLSDTFKDCYPDDTTYVNLDGIEIRRPINPRHNPSRVNLQRRLDLLGIRY